MMAGIKENIWDIEVPCDKCCRVVWVNILPDFRYAFDGERNMQEMVRKAGLCGECKPLYEYFKDLRNGRATILICARCHSSNWHYLTRSGNLFCGKCHSRNRQTTTDSDEK